jgi:hypothetical protein
MRKRGQEMTREQRIIMVVFLSLLSSGAFGAAGHGWAGIFVVVCLGLTFGLLDDREDDDGE